MSATWLCLRSDLRSRWRSWLALALIAGVAGGMVIAAAAGARRTDSAYPRFLRAQRAVDVAVISRRPSKLGFDIGLDAVEALPQVADHQRFELFLVGIRTGEGRVVPLLDSPPASSADGRLGSILNRPKILEGRRPDPNRADEVSVGFLTAERFGLRVGSQLLLKLALPNFAQLLEFQQVSAGSGDAWDFAAGQTVTLQVVGIEATPGGFPPLSGGQGPPLFLTPAFHRTYAEGSLTTDGTVVVLQGDASLGAFRDSLARIITPDEATILTKEDQAANVQRSIHLQAVAFRLMAGLTGFAAMLIVSQAFTRQVFAESADYPTLAAVGMTRRQLWALGMWRAALMCLPAAVAAAAVAVLLSPATPIGLARIAEPDPGFHLDWLALTMGIGGLIVAILVTTAIPAWWATKARRRGQWARQRRPSRGLTTLGRTMISLRPPAVILAGVRMALQPGRDQDAVPIRSTVSCASAGVAALAAAVYFGASLQHLVRTPTLYGQRWDAHIGGRALRDLSDEVVPVLRTNTSLSDISEGTITEANVGGVLVGVLAVDQLQGQPLPVAIEGRSPASPDEILLGSQTFRETKASIGDQVVIRIGEASRNMRIVGRGVLPDLSDLGRLGEGAAITYQGLVGMNPKAARNVFLVRFSPEADRDGVFRQLETSFGRIGVKRGSPPTDLANFGRVNNLPVLLALVLAFVGFSTMIHTLLMSIRRRRRDLAVLKTIGFVRRQIAWVVAWQATTLAVIVLLVGLPLGVVAGGRAWRLFASELGVLPEAVVPVRSLFLIVPGTLLIANLVAAIPARLAARAHPGEALRSE